MLRCIANGVGVWGVAFFVGIVFQSRVSRAAESSPGSAPAPVQSKPVPAVTKLVAQAGTPPPPLATASPPPAVDQAAPPAAVPAPAAPPSDSTAAMSASPAAASGAAIAPAPAPAPAFSASAAPSFDTNPIGAIANAADLTLKMYGDTGFTIRNNADQNWPTGTSNPDVYARGVGSSFFAPRLDIFGSADVGNLSFLTEVVFEANPNNFGVDIERMQLNYIFTNWLRVSVGRTHTAWGYYNDSYHHGNLFELTTSRPYSVNFEDSFGIVLSHNVGVAIDGTFDLGDAGSFRYDAEIGNGRTADVTGVAMEYAESVPKTFNVRLRWLPIDGLILGINGMEGVVPRLAGGGTAPDRPQTEELVGGAHVVYTENHFLIDVEAFDMRHNPDGLPSTNIYGGFAEFGYTLGAFTPYFRPEYMRFPRSGDIIFQYGATDAQGILTGSQSIYAGYRDFLDLRIGVKWLCMPQLALKLEVERLARDAQNQEIATAKVAFGF